MINLIGAIHPRDNRQTGFWIFYLQQFVFDLGQQCIGLSARLHDPVALAASQVQVKAVKPDSIGSRLRPIHSCKGLVGIEVGAALQLDVTIVQQPGIQIERPIIWSEAMIGKHKQSRIVI